MFETTPTFSNSLRTSREDLESYPAWVESSPKEACMPNNNNNNNSLKKKNSNKKNKNKTSSENNQNH